MADIFERSFRVWDDREKQFQDRFNAAIDCEGELLASEGGGAFYDTYHKVAPDELSHFTVELCSGVEDSFGTLIYEGDIVKLGSGNRGIVFYKNGAFAVTNLGAEDMEDFLATFVDYGWSISVIGNIHENPELLE